MRVRAYTGLLAAVTAASALALSGLPAASAGAEPDARAFSQSVGAPNVKKHLVKFQEIADAHGGTRAAGTSGNQASMDYVTSKLRAAGYAVTLQEFEFPFFRDFHETALNRVSPDAKNYVVGTDIAILTYTGSGKATATVQGVDLVLPPTPTPSSSSGCEASDFAGFIPGNIALLQRGTCSYQAKAELAEAAGASGVIIFNEGQPGEGANDRRALINGSLTAPTTHIPVIGTTFAVGEELAAGGTTVTISAKAEGDLHRKTYNILAESRWGNPDRVVMVGAHLDSALEGPGINDNGSGSAGVLETALKANTLPTRNKLRFAFWGGEELGLLGSKHYVTSLSAEEKAKVRMYLNFDMIASPNYAFRIFDGDDSDATGSPAGPAGSDKIEKVIQSYFTAIGRPYTSADFTGRSDYGPFITAGIPAGGLNSGAEGIKTTEEAARFGGEAGVAYDKCYHLACDTIANVNDTALAVNTGAIATATIVYAYSDELPGDGVPAAARSGVAVPKDDDHADVSSR